MKEIPSKLSGSFLWRTKDGIELPVSSMGTRHLYYSVRMIFNHTVPKGYELYPYNKYRDVSEWPINYRKCAIQSMLKELNKRNDIEHFWIKELDHMRHVTKILIGSELTG